MNPKFRWLLHRAVEENFDGLFTFSVGEETLEQVVVCRLPFILRKIASGECRHEKALVWAGRKHGCLGPPPKSSRKESNRPGGRGQKAKVMKTVVQEASSRPQQTQHPSDSSRDSPRAQKQKKTSRRPDIQLYVPRARRSGGSPAAPSAQPQPLAAPVSPALPRTKPKQDPEPCPDKVLHYEPEEGHQTEKESLHHSANQAEQNFLNAQVLRDCSDVCERGVDVGAPCGGGGELSLVGPLPTAESLQAPGEVTGVPVGEVQALPPTDSLQCENPAVDHNANCTLPTVPGTETPVTNELVGESKRLLPESQTTSEDEGIVVGSLCESGSSQGVLCAGRQRETTNRKEQTSSPQRLRNTKAKEKDLHISTLGSPEHGRTLAEEEEETAGECPSSLPPESSERESWDNLFDENGDCLHPSVLNGLKCALGGKVQIQKPKYDYLVFQPQEPDLSDECYDHVLEVYDFPADFKTQNLMMAFASFKDRGFDIKWVDDTHALAVFSSPVAANEALRSLQSPFIKVRPVSQGISKSKFMISKNLDYLLPSKPRPETSALRARRMITGALGMRSSVSKEERETERRKLQAAKENKRQVAKQKQDIWNGIVS